MVAPSSGKLRVFVGTEPKQWLASEVLRYSIAKRTPAPFEFQELKHLPFQLQVPMVTGFSIYRFAIPEMCQFKGRAIYLDADIVVLCDLMELFQLNMNNAGALARRLKSEDPAAGRYTSVMLLDCAKLTHWKLNELVDEINKHPEKYHSILWASSQSRVSKDFGDLPEEFNHLDLYNQNTKIIHFTDLSAQPWRYQGHPYAHVFLNELKAAIEEEEIPLDAVQREIQYGHIYPQILSDMGL